MKKTKKISAYLLVSLVSLLLVACSKSDEYKDLFLKGGEIRYAGKLDSVQTLSGRSRVWIKGIITADPNVSKAKVYWNNKKDSLEVPIVRTANADTVYAKINNLNEGVYSFLIFTFDNKGNASVPVTTVGKVYGANYESGLLNRTIENTVITAGNLVITWGTVSPTSGINSVELSFIDVNNILQNLKIPASVKTSTLLKYKKGTAVTYRTVYKPDLLSIDLFYSKYESRIY